MADNKPSNLIELTHKNDSVLSQLFPAKTLSEVQAELKNKIWRGTPIYVNSIDEHNQDKVGIFVQKSFDQNKSKDQVYALAQAKLNQALRCALLEVIRDYKPSTDDPDALLVTTPSQLAEAFMDNTIADNASINWRWIDKATQDNGPYLIYMDICLTLSTMSDNMQASIYDVAQHTTLFVPLTAIPYLTASNSSSSSALDMLHSAFSELKVVVDQDITHIDDTFALFVCDDPAYGKPGYLALKEAAKLSSPDDGYNAAIRYDLTIPAHKLVITNPEQIAILTGI